MSYNNLAVEDRELKKRPTELGKVIKEARIKQGYTQQSLAEKIGKDASTISRWEIGERHPKQRSLLKLSNLLGTKIQTLQALAGYTPEFDWYLSLSAKPDSEEDILLSAAEDEKENLRQYLRYLRFSEQLKKSHSKVNY